MPINTLAAIETKVRRLTRSPSTAQLSPIDLDNYINTFVVYDFPEHLRTFNLRQQYSFYCNPFQDIYPTDETILPTNPLYNFQNRILTIHPPVYIAGYEALYTQSREQFYMIYPKIINIQTIGVYGDGVTQYFTGYIYNFGPYPFIPPTPTNPAYQTTPILSHEVLFSSVDISEQGLAMADMPLIDAVTLNPTHYGLLYPPSFPKPVPIRVTAQLGGANRVPYISYMNDPLFPIDNYVNYTNGHYAVTFISPPGKRQRINSQSVPYQPSLPQAMCFYQDHFILRPIPDQPYKINFEVYIRPTELLATDQAPDLEEWWQYIALGAAIKVFQDRFDFDSVNLIMPEFKVQQALVNRRSIVQYTNERVATIYTENVANGEFNGWGQGGGNF